MIPIAALVLAFSVAPSTIALASKAHISQTIPFGMRPAALTLGNNYENLDRVSEKFTARSLAGEYTLANIPLGFTRFDDGTPGNLKFSLWLNSDRTFDSELILTSADPERAPRSPLRIKAKGEFYIDGNSLKISPKENLVISRRNEENISTHEIEFTISANGQVLQQVGQKGIFLVRK